MFNACSNVIFIVSLRSVAPASNKLEEDKFDNGKKTTKFLDIMGKQMYCPSREGFQKKSIILIL